MSNNPATVAARPSNTKGIIVLVLAVLPVVLTLHLIVGPLLALATLGLFVAALILTMIAQRDGDTGTQDPETGLPDREAALRRLGDLAAHPGTPRRQAAVIVVSLARASFANAEERRSTVLLAALRMARRLRKGDQIVRVGPAALAAILVPSRGLNARSAREILDRIDGLLREPFRLGDRELRVEADIGACLQTDAPAADARAWLEAAEEAAEISRTTGEPHVYWIALTSAEAATWPSASGGDDEVAGNATRSG